MRPISEAALYRTKNKTELDKTWIFAISMSNFEACVNLYHSVPKYKDQLVLMVMYIWPLCSKRCVYPEDNGLRSVANSRS